MKHPAPHQWILALAGAVLLIGLVWTVHTVRDFPDQRRRLEASRSDLHTLRLIERQQRSQTAAVTVFDQLDRTRPHDLNQLARDWAPGARTEARRRETVPAWGEWQATRWEISFDQVPADQLGDFLRQAEATLPPWRWIEGSLRAADQTQSGVRATLILEALEKR